MFLSIFLFSCLIVLGCLLCRKPNILMGQRLPGPTPLPILGNLLQIGFRPHITFTKWAKYYGPIYKVKIGPKQIVVVSDYKLIKEIFSKTVSTGRLDDNPVLMEFSKGPYGIVNTSGSTWKAQRKFTVRTLGNFGFAKSSMETLILDEVQVMLDWLRTQECFPILGTRIFNAPVVNSLWRIVSGERYNWEESRSAILDAMGVFLKELMNVTTNGLLFLPVLRLIAPNLFGWNRYVKSVNAMMDLIKKSIADHKQNLNSSELRDFMDHYIFEIQNEMDQKSSFYKEAGDTNMIATIFDLFFGGSESSSGLLSWTLLYLSENQNVQKSLQKEINKVIGCSTLPSISDRPSMPYCEAVISEILRITAIAPLGVPHKMKADFNFYGFHLPEGATLIANIYAVHHDPDIWGDPDTFRPNRFLNKDGTKFVNNDALIPFNEGKRKCFGEILAKDTLFLFVSGIFQRFTILPDPNNEGTPNFEPDIGLSLLPKPFKIVIAPRKN